MLKIVVSVAGERPTGSSPDWDGVLIKLVVATDVRALSESGIAEFSSRAEMKAGPLGAAGVEPPSHSRGDGEEEHEDGEKDFTKIAVWTPEAEKPALTSDGRRLSEEVITVRAEIESVSPWAETRESPVLSRDDGEDEKNKEEEDGQADEEVETACSFSLCCNSSVCT